MAANFRVTKSELTIPSPRTHTNLRPACTFTTAEHTNQERKQNVTKVAAVRHAIIATIRRADLLLPHLVIIIPRRHVITMNGTGIIMNVIVTIGTNVRRTDITQIGIVTTGTVGMTVTVTTTVTAMVPLHQETTTETIPLLHIVVLHHHQGMNLETDIMPGPHLQDPSDLLLHQGDHAHQNIEAAEDTNKSEL